MSYSDRERKTLEALPWEGEIRFAALAFELDAPLGTSDCDRLFGTIDRLREKGAVTDFGADGDWLKVALTEQGRELLRLWNVGAGTDAANEWRYRCRKCNARLEVTTRHNGASELHCLWCDADETTAALERMDEPQQ